MTIAHSLWFLPLCILAGVVYAAILYWKTDRYDFPQKAKIVMAICRMFVVGLIVFLLFNPMWKNVHKELEKPIVVVGIDNSQSLVLTDKADYYQGDFQNKLQRFLAHLDKKYTVETYLIGDSLKQHVRMPDFSDKKTDLADFFNYANAFYYHRNVGAFVLLSDGIFNDGASPVSAIKSQATPVYVMAMGDTSVKQDLKIAKTNYNKKVFINNVFPIKVLVQAEQLSGKKTKMTVFQNKEKIFEKDININNNKFQQWENLSIEAKKAGLLHYRIELSEVEGELTKVNNVANIVIEVLDSRKKVLVIYRSPHPDVSALTAALQTSDVYQVESFAVEKFSGNLSAFDMLVLHGLPSVDFPVRSLIDQMSKLEMPCFYFIGKQNNYLLFNRLNAGVQINNVVTHQENEVTGVLNTNFSNFSLTTQNEDILSSFPPMKVPFGQYSLAPTASVLLFQKVGNVKTTYPLLLYNQGEQARQVVCLGDGLWRWRLHNFLLAESHDQFNELILKSFQYMGTKADKSFFRVEAKSVFYENEPVVFEAELYNKNYELTVDADVSLDLTDGEQHTHHFIFSKERQRFSLNIGLFPSGDYHWKASTMYNGEKYILSGSFIIQPINVEGIDLTANMQMLNNLATQTNGQMFADTDFDGIEKALENNEQIRPVAHFQEKYLPLSENIMILGLIMLLLTMEWFLRKFNGAY
ncbi:MAG: hypothetical protein J5606_08825 [Bacteroidales bacterium]|nr:hypothetical protein [Bacteroidales bacterium]